MHKAEKERFHQAADRVWEIAKEAKTDEFRELERVLIQLCEFLHARGSEVQHRFDSVL